LLSDRLESGRGFRVRPQGSLTLRAAGNLTILGNISDGFSSATSAGVLQDTASWDLRLVSGADLTSASALTVKPLAALAVGQRYADHRQQHVRQGCPHRHRRHRYRCRPRPAARAQHIGDLHRRSCGPTVYAGL
jgi:hypothetical protein